MRGIASEYCERAGWAKHRLEGSASESRGNAKHGWGTDSRTTERVDSCVYISSAKQDASCRATNHIRQAQEKAISTDVPSNYIRPHTPVFHTLQMCLLRIRSCSPPNPVPFVTHHAFHELRGRMPHLGVC
ncbi:unnamed protein product, partial [Ectocarpus sp. 12 AP-2014]